MKKAYNTNKSLINILIAITVIICFATLPQFIFNVKGLEFIDSDTPSGGGEITCYDINGDVIGYDTAYAYQAAKDSAGIWLHFENLNLENKLHFIAFEDIYAAWDGDRDIDGLVAEQDEMMVYSHDSSDLKNGIVVYYGKSPHKYIDFNAGQAIIDTIETKATLTYRTITNNTLSLTDSIEELKFTPVLRVLSDFKVNIRIESKAPEKGNATPVGSWFPAQVLFDSLTSWDEPLYNKLYLGFNSTFKYDDSKPAISGLQTKAINDTTIELTWDKPSINTDSVIIEFTEGTSILFKTLVTLPGESSKYIHTGLNKHTVYAYKIKGMNANGTSDYTSHSTETTANTFSAISGTTSGYTKVNAQVNESGGVSASIPITIPTGTSGMQPQLALSVNHSSGEPSIGGLSAISRVPRTYAQDGIIDGIHFDWITDRYALDGERLIAVDGNYGSANTKYRTEQETFQHIVSNGSSNAGPTSFIVKTKDGLTKYYGYTEDSRIELGDSETNVIYWLLNKVEDVAGNYFTISYEEDKENGVYRPKQIDYTGNEKAGLDTYCKVLFEYEDRPDVFSKYMLGSLVKNTKRLKAIKGYYESSLIREYRVAYSQLGINNISYIESVTEYGSDGTNFAPTKFEWADADTVSFSTPEVLLSSFGNGSNLKPYSSYGYHENFVDLNNDGKTDYIFVPEGKNDLYAALSNGQSFDEPTVWLEAGCAAGKHPYSGGGSHERFADFNGDNYIDYAWVPNGLRTLWVALSNGTNFETPKEWLGEDVAGGLDPLSASGLHEYFLDYDGDGRSDFIWYPEGDEKWWIAKSNGTGFETPKIFIDKSDAANNALISTNGRYQTFMDVNGDGYLDFLYVPSGKYALWVIRATASGEFYDAITWLDDGSADRSNPYSQEGKFESYADVNGDGLPDKVWTPDGKSTLWVALATGNGYETPKEWLGKLDNGMYCNSLQGRHQTFLDLNKDGLTDYLFYPYITGWTNVKYAGLYVCYSTGDSFTQPQLLLKNQFTSINQTGPDGLNLYSTDGAREKYADINGDGTVDKVWVPAGKYELHVSYLTSPNRLLKSITNGHGLVTEYEYKPLTDTSIYTRGSGAEYPFMDFQAPMYVVTKQTSNDGLGGDYSVAYKYANAQLQVKGRGFRGFGKTETKNLETGSRSVTYFERDYRYVGVKVRRSEEYAPSGTLLSETDNKLKYENYANNVHWSYIEESTNSSYELDGSLIKTISSYYEYDDYGNPTVIEIDYGNGYKDITENSYENNEAKWHLGRLTYASVQRKVPDQPSGTRETAFDYDRKTGMLIKEIIEPNSSLKLTKEYVHDKYGNTIESHTKGQSSDNETRSHYTSYDEKGRFAIKSTNTLGHSETKVYEPYYGNVLSITGPNGLSTHYKYDGFGRKTQEIRADGNTSRISYMLCSSGKAAPANALYYLQTETSGLPPTITYYDILDRKVRTESIGFNGEKIYSDIVYNHKGEVEKESDPYSDEGLTAQWTTHTYDELSRTIQSTAPGNRNSIINYKGLTTEYINPKGQKTINVTDVVGRLTQVIDNSSNKLFYEYDAFGNIITITDPDGNEFVAEYNIRGNKTKVIDPDMGTFEYTYNAFGEMLSQIYPEGYTMELKYDALSRLVKKVEPEGISTWEYDSKDHAIGKLCKVTAPDNYEQEFEFDEFGRVIQETIKLDDESYTTASEYDKLGRVINTTYPSGLATVNSFNDFGFLTQVKRKRDDYLFWQADNYNARGQCLSQSYGNNLSVLKTFNDETGLLEEIKSANIQGDIQHLKISYDKLGNVLTRSDEIKTLKESFEYDALNRLISTQVSELEAIAINYNAIGNITYKSDVGNYTYNQGGAGPHAVTSIDGDGCPSFKTEGIEYYSYQKVKTLTKDSISQSYLYGPDRLRYKSLIKKNADVIQSKIYIGNLYEKIIEGDTIKEQHYIHTPEGAVAIQTVINNEKTDVRYLHKDHLGSLQTVTNELAQVIEILSFDPWGKPRDAATWGALETNPETLFARGFTMHEYMSFFSLVNMNGRIYDPVIGRFISADPFIDGMNNLQGFNRFSYVHNNPLSFTDPSGYGLFSKAWKSVKKSVKKIGREIGKFWDKYKVQIISIGVGILTGGAFSALAGSLLAGTGTVLGVAAGSIGSAIGFGFGMGLGSTSTAAVMNGASLGDALKAGLKQGAIGATTGALTLGCGTALSHGILQGGIETAQGGKFEHGFLAGFVGAATGMWSAKKTLLSRTTISAIAGGVASKIGGGKFSNGAVSGAFTTLFKSASDDAMGVNDISEKGKNFIKKEEDLRLNPYDANGRGDMTIGYGHKILPGEDFSDGITSAQAEELFNSDLQTIVIDNIAKYVKVPLSQQQYDALASYVFNVGPNNSLIGTEFINKLNNHNYSGACAEMDIITSGGIKMNGLVKRRNAEQNLWKNGKY